MKKPRLYARVTVVAPDQYEKAYAVAGEQFCDLWGRITGRRPALLGPGSPLPPGPLALIGSDAVNPAVHRLVLAKRFKTPAVRQGTDDYQIDSARAGGRPILLLAGGSGRSTLYAVYDFFERYAAARYFWDGDRLPRAPGIRLDGCRAAEKPRFAYRGLRYFAHRGLHRFQAEHWDLEDWQREIDWLLKKRLNLFMLRTGIDDLFQRAFPEHCPYPPADGPDPDAKPQSYDDRTSFWPLKCRGDLRRQVLRYAFDRGLLHPEDVGTITHWYSHTPSSFYAKQPDFPLLKQSTAGYNTLTGKVWDIHDERAWRAYWRLTETHIREFGQPRLFHTIGLAERRFGKDDAENLQIKLYTYRKIQALLRAHYPDAPLLIASWDFIMYWKPADVRRLLQELDPEKTLVLEYTADHPGLVPWKEWGMHRRFPWIFGAFRAFASGTQIGTDYRLLAERLAEAAADPACRGFVTWPENSHTDTFFLEYLAANSWQPRRLGVRAAAARFCAGRYPPALAAPMRSIWTRFFDADPFLRWNVPARRAGCAGVGFEPQFRLLSQTFFCDLDAARVRLLRREYRAAQGGLAPLRAVLPALAEAAPRAYGDPFWRRDAVDIARTILQHALRWTLARWTLAAQAWRPGRPVEPIRRDFDRTRALMRLFGDLLAQHDDFSVAHSFRRLTLTAPINPHAEQTLKGNIENGYCRTGAYELVRYLFEPELEVYLAWAGGLFQAAERPDLRRPGSFDAAQAEIRDRFYATPLADMAPPEAARSAKALQAVLAAGAAALEDAVWSRPVA